VYAIQTTYLELMHSYPYYFLHVFTEITTKTAVLVAPETIKSASSTDSANKPVDIPRLDIRVGYIISAEKVNLVNYTERYCV